MSTQGILVVQSLRRVWLFATQDLTVRPGKHDEAMRYADRPESIEPTSACVLGDEGV